MKAELSIKWSCAGLYLRRFCTEY